MKIKRLLGLCETEGCFHRGTFYLDIKATNDKTGEIKIITQHYCKKCINKIIKEASKVADYAEVEIEQPHVKVHFDNPKEIFK
ncbi:hypothetical protein Z959_08435 [Clostridium novyi B str. ATCC 27606]|uniref:Uncharacterized protein n=1 Tax=Clostridium novyi B str. ATCC 27606 TaxID=1443123 RepID=A0AA40IUZ9_CLONO|nr:hypothetical protein [Clostridium novyi]KEI16852.1 hypothetical protein Z959_08435 [Clostridium novyi B str. ATCC 27606]